MATSYLSPGVYVEEVDRGSKPIEAVGTNTVGFLGESMMGPANQAVLITNWTQFVKTFGDFTQSTHLAHAVYGFFNNGGSRCFVVNVGAPASLDIEPARGRRRAGRRRKARRSRPARRPRRRQEAGGNTDGLYIGKDNGPGARTGLKCFEEIDEISLVAAPGQTSPAVQDALLTHCEIAQGSLRDSRLARSMQGGVDKLARPRDSKYGAYYFPWIQVYDPERGNVFVPPSGHVAGVYARTDNERGVHKAPANEIVRGALGLRYNISQGRAGHPQPEGHQLHPHDAGRRHPHLGRPHAVVGSVVALHQRSPPLHHGGDVDRARHAVGRLRAQRPAPVEARHPHHLVASSRSCGARARSWARRRRRPSTSSATRRPTRPRSSTWVS